MSEKILILTEKREAGRDLASTLGDSVLGNNISTLEDVSKQKGFLEGEKYLISWASGHLFVQLKPSQIKEEYQLFSPYENIEDYKMPHLKDEIISKASSQANKQRQIKIIKELLERKDIKEIIVMTDADAEGEAIGRDMLNKITKKLPTQNITRAFNAGSFKAGESVKKALDGREPINIPKYNNLYDMQQARSKADYLVGMKLTKALCDTYQDKHYTGRVKGVVTALIGNREEEILNFKSRVFYQLEGKKSQITLKHFYYEESEDESGKSTQVKQDRYFDKNVIDTLEENIKNVNYTGVIMQYNKETTVTKTRPLPLSGTDFASEMMGKYKITYKQCNQILDYLRQEGFTTYPGTNGRYFSLNDGEDVQKAFITAKKYFNVEEATYTKEAGLYDDKKASKQNHTPLSVTGKVPSQRDINTWADLKLPKIKEGYDLIAQRILVHFLPDDAIEKQQLVVDIAGALFFVNGQKAMTQGWRSLVSQDIKNTLFEMDVKEGDEITLETTEIKTGHTKCPVLFNEKTLTDMMLNISKVVDTMIADEDDPDKLKELKKNRKLLKDAEGIGTDRTRESIISDLIEEETIESLKEGIRLTKKGQILFKVLPEKLKDPILTAEWESAFEDIRKGEKKLEKVLSDIDRTLMESMIPQIVSSPIEEFIKRKYQNITHENIHCPLCGSSILETDKTFKCSANIFKDQKQSGCLFNIFKDQTKFFGRNISDKDLDALFKATKENPLKENSNGIYIDTDSKYFLSVAFEQKEAKPNELVETPKTYKLNDKFVFKNMLGKDLTAKQATQLLEGATIELKRKSKAGKEYVAKVILNEKGGVDFVKDKKK